MPSKRDQYHNGTSQANPLSASFSEADAALYGELSALTEVSRGDTALAVANDGTIRVGNFAMTSCGLQVVGEVTPDEWDHLGDILRQMDCSLQWLIGDWIVYGNTKWGQTYEMIAEKTGYNKKTLYNYFYVASSIHFSLRRENLTFGHHSLVAGFKGKIQDQWLEYADQNKLSIAAFRKTIESQTSLATPNPPTRVDKFLQRYTPFAKKQLALAKEAAPNERLQMASLLRQLADQIEQEQK